MILFGEKTRTKINEVSSVIFVNVVKWQESIIEVMLNVMSLNTFLQHSHRHLLQFGLYSDALNRQFENSLIMQESDIKLINIALSHFHLRRVIVLTKKKQHDRKNTLQIAFSHIQNEVALFMSKLFSTNANCMHAF